MSLEYPARIPRLDFAWYLSGLNLHGVEYERLNGKENPYCRKVFYWGGSNKSVWGYDFSEAVLQLGRYERDPRYMLKPYRFVVEREVKVSLLEEATEKLVEYVESKK